VAVPWGGLVTVSEEEAMKQRSEERKNSRNVGWLNGRVDGYLCLRGAGV